MTRKRGPIGAGIDGHTSRCRCSTECAAQTRRRINTQRRERAQRLGLVIRRGRMLPPSDQPSGVRHGTLNSWLLGCTCDRCESVAPRRKVAA
jgi:hypothetical protein